MVLALFHNVVVFQRIDSIGKLSINLLRSACVPEHALFPASKDCAARPLSDPKGVRKNIFSIFGYYFYALAMT